MPAGAIDIGSIKGPQPNLALLRALLRSLVNDGIGTGSSILDNFAWNAELEKRSGTTVGLRAASGSRAKTPAIIVADGRLGIATAEPTAVTISGSAGTKYVYADVGSGGTITLVMSTTAPASEATNYRRAIGEVAWDGSAISSVIAYFVSGSNIPGGNVLTQTSTPLAAVLSGTDTYTGSLSPAIAAYTTNQVYDLRFPNANSSTTPTVNLNGLGAKTLVDVNGGAISVGRIAANTWHLVLYDGTNMRVLTLPAPGLPRGYIAGFALANNATDANNDIDVAIGAARDSTDAEDLALVSAITKRLDAAWAVGTNQGGLDTGTKANSTWYHLWLIKRPDTGVVDVLFSTSATAPTMPTSYTTKRRLGSVLTDGSGNIRAFLQRGDSFKWLSPILDVNVTTPGTSAVLRALSTPLGVSVDAFLNVTLDCITGGSTQCYISDPGVTDVAPSLTAAPLGAPSLSGNNYAGIQLRCHTNTSSQVRTRVSNSGGLTLRIATLGWTDNRGWDD